MRSHVDYLNSVIKDYCNTSYPIPNIKFGPRADALFRDNRQLKEFSIKGRKVMAYSKKDAITRLKHMKKK